MIVIGKYNNWLIGYIWDVEDEGSSPFFPTWALSDNG